MNVLSVRDAELTGAVSASGVVLRVGFVAVSCGDVVVLVSCVWTVRVRRSLMVASGREM